ncbi:MAG: cobyrinic acid ac-diamide synthase, partial [Candidatus Omnitrophota bacterium]
MKLKIAISSGKGGTGKTFVATNLAKVLSKNYKTRYIDCDVEEPNGYLFLKPEVIQEKGIKVLAPSFVDENKCIGCRKCIEACRFSALAFVKNKVLIFKELCHACGACKIACPENAFVEEEKDIGVIKEGRAGNIDFYYAILEISEGTKTPRLVKKLKEYIDEGINILDSPPGTTCPVVETVKNVDLCILVTDPTPFGINDLKLALQMSRSLSLEPVVLVNRAGIDDKQLKDYCTKENLEIIGEIPDDLEIAKVYSQGELVVERIPHYENVFKNLALKIIERAKNKKTPQKAERKEIGKPVLEKKVSFKK